LDSIAWGLVIKVGKMVGRKQKYTCLIKTGRKEGITSEYISFD
jgi:hypothetical protein